MIAVPLFVTKCPCIVDVFYQYLGRRKPEDRMRHPGALHGMHSLAAVLFYRSVDLDAHYVVVLVVCVLPPTRAK